MKKTFFLIFFIIYYFLFPNLILILAQTCAPPEVSTSLGCISTDPTDFIIWLLKSAIRIGGGIAFLLIIFGAIKVLTSAGNPENVRAGQEMITSALSGLLFIIFSIFLLELIGVKILNIPGLGKP